MQQKPDIQPKRLNKPSFGRRPRLIVVLAIIVLIGTIGLAQLVTSQQAGQFEPGRGSRASWARLKFRVKATIPDWYYHPEGDLSLIERIRGVTTANLTFSFNSPDVARLDEMIKYPFIFMHGQNPPSLSETERQNIREYLRRGGFIFIDDCVLGHPQLDLFYVGMRQEMRRILPNARYVNFDNDKNHEIFRCLYRLPNGMPHPQGRNHGLIGVYDKDRLVAIMCASDLHCAWAQHLGRQKEQAALAMGVNIYVYAMTH